ncbi:MAG: hypothetical protein H0Z38_06910 [Firmicutes bacterium]|nr:hypothetical protein [Bacillota bacterium]
MWLILRRRHLFSATVSPARKKTVAAMERDISDGGLTIGGGIARYQQAAIPLLDLGLECNSTNSGRL